MSDTSRFESELERNHRILDEKPLLRDVYTGFYTTIAAELNRDVGGDIIELGSAGREIKTVIPDCITTNMVRAPEVDGREDACRLSFPDGSLSNLILLDVFHHLRYPGTALAEFHRVLAPGGRVVLMEPDLGLLGRLVYGLFHPEPVTAAEGLHWEIPAGCRAESGEYYAAQGNAWRIFIRGDNRQRLRHWTVRKLRRFSALSYVASGGYTGPQLYPRNWLPVLRRIDRLCDRLPWLFSTRLLVVLERPSPGSHEPDAEALND